MTATATTLRTWGDLLAVDPSLAEIDVQLARYRRVVCPENQWSIYDRMKSQLRRRLGWDARHARPELQTAEAFEIGIGHVCRTLGI